MSRVYLRILMSPGSKKIISFQFIMPPETLIHVLSFIRSMKLLSYFQCSYASEGITRVRKFNKFKQIRHDTMENMT